MGPATLNRNLLFGSETELIMHPSRSSPIVGRDGGVNDSHLPANPRVYTRRDGRRCRSVTRPL